MHERVWFEDFFIYFFSGILPFIMNGIADSQGKGICHIKYLCVTKEGKKRSLCSIVAYSGVIKCERSGVPNFNLSIDC